MRSALQSQRRHSTPALQLTPELAAPVLVARLTPSSETRAGAIASRASRPVGHGNQILITPMHHALSRAIGNLVSPPFPLRWNQTEFCQVDRDLSAGENQLFHP